MQHSPLNRPPVRDLLRQRRIYAAACLLAVPALWGLAQRDRGQAEPLPPPPAVDGPAPTGIASQKQAASEPADGEAAGEIILAEVDSGDEAGEADETGVDAHHTRKVVGVWEDEYQGKRELTVRADGTATMVVYPSGIGRKLFADRLQFEIDWTLTNGRIVMITTSGHPEKQTRLVLKLYGNRAEYTLENLDDRQLLLVDADGKTRYDWRRVEAKDP